MIADTIIVVVFVWYSFLSFKNKVEEPETEPAGTVSLQSLENLLVY